MPDFCRPGGLHLKPALIALTLLVLAPGLAAAAETKATLDASTCYYDEWKRIDPIPVNTGTPLDGIVISIGTVKCNPPPP